MNDRTPAPAAAKLRAFRARMGLTQAEAATALHCSGPTFNDWENGKKRPEAKFIARIAAWTKGEVDSPDWILPSEDVAIVPAEPKAGEAA